MKNYRNRSFLSGKNFAPGLKRFGQSLSQAMLTNQIWNSENTGERVLSEGTDVIMIKQSRSHAKREGQYLNGEVHEIGIHRFFQKQAGVGTQLTGPLQYDLAIGNVARIRGEGCSTIREIEYRDGVYILQTQSGSVWHVMKT